MQLITASDIKKNSMILQNALKDDLLVTKRDKPFVVIVDYDRYL
jgi:PHD/YefM family antitoxin component YafN of YafNO toxin-antitoxin module